MSKETKHTPGDWHAQHRITQDGKGGTKRYHILAGADRSIQICTMPGWDDEDEANAKLVAAAPKLLTALKNAIENLKVCADDSEEAGYPSRAEAVREDIKAYRAAIKKAIS